MELYLDDSGLLVGTLPTGEQEVFTDQEEYEDEYYDSYFELNNCFQIEMPEYA